MSPTHGHPGSTGRALGAFLSCAILAAAAAGTVEARTIHVTTTLDVNQAAAADCTLRDAVIAANTDAASGACPAGEGADRIKLAVGASYVLSVPGTLEGFAATGDLDVTDDLTILGNGSTIDAGGLDRIFDVHADAPTGTRLSLADVVLTGGDTLDTGSGGAVRVVNGILELDRVTLSGNTATAGGAVFLRGQDSSPVVGHVRSCVIEGNRAAAGTGGGLAYEASGDSLGNRLVVEDSTFRGNETIIGTGSGGWGGGLAAMAFESTTLSLEIHRSVFEGNRSAQGGGFYVQGVGAAASSIDARVVETSVRDNIGVNGGGITALGPNADLTIERSTINENTAVAGSIPQSGIGGGVANLGATVLVVNTTISGNAAIGNPSLLQGACGGVCNVATGNGASLTLVQSTITANQAALGGGVGTATIAPGPQARTTFTNTIVAGNSALMPFLGPSCARLNGIHESQGGNIDDGVAGSGPLGLALGCDLSLPGDQQVVDAGLAALADNGGATWTHALLADSPAVDAGDDATCADALVGRRDQRMRPRHPNACDSGAFERTADFAARAGLE